MVLVTGGTGTSGFFIIRELQRRGIAVRALVRPASVEKIQNSGVDVALGDLSDSDSLRRAAEGVQGIIHAACTFTNPQIDMAAMAKLLKAWEEGPFVFISSVDVYGIPQYLPLDETHPLNSTDANYGQAKVQCEMQLRDAAKKRGRSDWSILRPPHILGPHPSCASKLAQRCEMIWAGKPVTLAGPTPDGEPHPGDGWVDARELAWAVAECLDRPLAEAANIVNSHFTYEEFFQTLIRLTGSASVIEYSSDVTGFPAIAWLYDGQRLAERIDFKAQYRWQDTLAEVINLPASGLEALEG